MTRIPSCHPEKGYAAKGLCHACYARIRRQDPIIRGKVNKANSEWHKRHPEYERVRSKRRYKENPERSKTLTHNWYIKHKARAKFLKLRWQENNREKHLAQMRMDVKRRKARKKGAAICSFTAKQWEQMKVDYGFRCVYCGCVPDKLTQDHCLPLSRGGDHEAANIVPACMTCNNKKHTMTKEEFLNALEA